MRKYSFIVPIYNVDKYLNRCLKSLKNQNFNQFEVVMVDDGSIDKSGKIAQSFSEKDKRFIYLKQKNQGLSAARNEGIKRASGDYLIFVDSDDFVEKNLLCTVDRSLDNYGDIDVLEYNAFKRVGGRISNYNTKYDNSCIVSGDKFLVQTISKFMYLYAAVWLKAVKRNFIIDNGLFFKKGRLHEDELWTPQVLLKANTYAYISNPLYNYVIRDGSINQNAYSKKNIEHEKKNCHDLQQIYRDSNLSDKSKKICLSYLSHHYMGLCTRGNYHVFLSDKKFVLQNSKIFGVYLEALVFAISPKLRSKIGAIIKRMRK
ncbi:glycosyltransferase [Ligilactobacillus pobuzihii]|uniref:Glycosyltransferase 2-like domain-containing protein n=1 Tax=Ligilactobacillus pobuzihii TaxID=449659 RepID=A0A0R2LSF1_9LACO|nr:glycosyltransferase [Ligilactobacillus pobuzihii]KRK09310.1 hypothetical protein FD11_GL000998 [Ligilactobacillus pobuzihii E100301 = KCTC 13174]KRO01322.1 hypothetical protein IV66_GL000395 [Ligilactobacillus pobuzihii]GEN49055.1 hypothetical protein LPO01_18470 [Ligilactobacillus pobuzihii]